MELGPQLRDASFFPVDLDVANRAFHFLRLPGAIVRDAPFLDNRLEIDWMKADRWHASQVQQSVPPRVPSAWLWHTSFCGSTLLARVLDLAPWSVSLREPLVLRRLSDAFDRGLEIGSLIPGAVALLSRPWHANAKTLIKPTHAALNIGVQLMDATHGDRAIVLVSDLEDFLISNLKKPAHTQEKVATLAERALRAGTLVRRLPQQALQPPDIACAVTLQWAAQRELVLDMQDRAQATVLRVEASILFADLAATAARCSKWLQLPIPEDELSARCALVGGRHAKAIDVDYDSVQRTAEKRSLRIRHGEQIRSALAWCERYVMPALRPEAI